MIWLNTPRHDKLPRADWARIGSLFLPYWQQQSAVLICIACASSLALTRGFVTANIIDTVIPKRDIHLLVVDVAAIIASQSFRSAIWILQNYYSSRVGNGIMRDIRTRLVAHLHKLPISFFTATKTGKIMNRVSNDIDNLQGIVAGTLTQIFANFIVIITTLIAMFAWNWKLALISVTVLPIMILPLIPIGRRVYTTNTKTRKQRDEIESITQETLSVSGITVMKSFVRENHERTRFFDVGTRLMNLEMNLGMVGQWFTASLEWLFVLGIALIWLGGGWNAIFHGLQIGVVVAFVGFIESRLYQPTQALIGLQVQIANALAVFERIFEYFDMQTEEYDPPNAIVLSNIQGDIRFEDVHFSYTKATAYTKEVTTERDPTNVDILKGIDFHIKPGQIAALVGLSGAGKTTVIQLVPRFYDPHSGRVLVDGHDVRTITLESLRNAVGIVTQETYLFHDTIANNLRYAKPDATDEELHVAVRQANLTNTIERFPEGYETVVGERGFKLSGGERQRLAIARVLLKDPRVLILDEATSALDSKNEAAIQAALEVCMRGRTSLIVAHRLSTIRSADVIFVIEDGRIAEVGTHTELLAQAGAYAHLYNTQFGLPQ